MVGVLVDPEAARAVHAVGLGGMCDLALGGKLFTPGDPPLRVTWTVMGLSNGGLTCTGPFYKGVRAHLGPMAYLQTAGVGVIVSTNRMQAADQAMFRYIGCEPTIQKILVLKSSVHFRGDSVAAAILAAAGRALRGGVQETFPARMTESAVAVRSTLFGQDDLVEA